MNAGPLEKLTRYGLTFVKPQSGPSSKSPIANAVICPLASTLCPALFAQNQAIHSHTTLPHQRTVTLDTILSCPDDPVIEEAFRTDKSTAHVLNPFHHVNKPQTEPTGKSALSKVKGFYDVFFLGNTASIFPVDRLSGRAIPREDLPFCNVSASMRFGEDDTSTPLSISIDGDGWIFDPNEIFAHAEQFKFDSGVFSDGSESYLIAIRGRTTIQFLASRSGLRFYRAIYSPPE